MNGDDIRELRDLADQHRRHIDGETVDLDNMLSAVASREALGRRVAELRARVDLLERLFVESMRLLDRRCNASAWWNDPPIREFVFRAEKDLGRRFMSR